MVSNRFSAKDKIDTNKRRSYMSGIMWRSGEGLSKREASTSKIPDLLNTGEDTIMALVHDLFSHLCEMGVLHSSPGSCLGK
jgi:hypothetical protein